jgi:hypothetical protein
MLWSNSWVLRRQFTLSKLLLEKPLLEKAFAYVYRTANTAASPKTIATVSNVFDLSSS